MTRSLQGGPAREARPRRPVRRRRGGEAGRARDLPPVPRAGRRDGAGRHRRDLRGDQGRLRGHARRCSSRRARSRIAGAKAWVEQHGAKNKTLVAIASGANMNFDRLRFVAERAELGEQREAVLAVTIPERPGSFRTLLRAARRAQRHRVQLPLSPTRARRTSSSASQVQGREETARIVRNLRAPRARARSTSPTTSSPSCTCATWSAGARRFATRRDALPLRVSRAARRADELPRPHERSDWNISLFHYRNHGADYGRVLVGMQVPRGELGAVPRASSRSSATPTPTRRATRPTSCSWL